MLFTYNSVRKGGKYVEANCPNGTEHASPDLGQVITSDQPREALTPWHQRHRQFQYLPRLENQPAIVEHQGANNARVLLTVTQPMTGDGQDLNAIPTAEFWCLPSGREETWIIHLETVFLGGWKVSKVEVQKPVQVVAYPGSVCQQGISQ
jgi:hypothetical protein